MNAKTLYTLYRLTGRSRRLLFKILEHPDIPFDVTRRLVRELRPSDDFRPLESHLNRLSLDSSQLSHVAMEDVDDPRLFRYLLDHPATSSEILDAIIERVPLSDLGRALVHPKASAAAMQTARNRLEAAARARAEADAAARAARDDHETGAAYEYEEDCRCSAPGDACTWK